MKTGTLMLQGARLQRDEGLSSPFLPSRFPSLVFLEDPLVQHGHFLTRLARPLPAPSVRPRRRRDKRGGQTHRISYKTSQIVDFPIKPLSFAPGGSAVSAGCSLLRLAK